MRVYYKDSLPTHPTDGTLAPIDSVANPWSRFDAPAGRYFWFVTTIAQTLISGNMSLQYRYDLDHGLYALSKVLSKDGITITTDRAEYANAITIKGGNRTVTSIVDTFTTDGLSSEYQLRLPPASEPVVTLNGATQTVEPTPTVLSSMTRQWGYSAASGILTQNPGHTIVGAHRTLSVTYNGLIPVIVQAENGAQITSRGLVEPGSGRHEFVEHNKDILVEKTAQDRAYGLLALKGVVPKTLELVTEEVGFFPGQKIPLNLPGAVTDANFIVEEVSIQAGLGQTECQVTARQGALRESLVRKLRNMQNEINRTGVQTFAATKLQTITGLDTIPAPTDTFSVLTPVMYALSSDGRLYDVNLETAGSSTSKGRIATASDFVDMAFLGTKLYALRSSGHVYEINKTNAANSTSLGRIANYSDFTSLAVVGSKLYALRSRSGLSFVGSARNAYLYEVNVANAASSTYLGRVTGETIYARFFSMIGQGSKLYLMAGYFGKLVELTPPSVAWTSLGGGRSVTDAMNNHYVEVIYSGGNFYGVTETSQVYEYDLDNLLTDHYSPCLAISTRGRLIPSPTGWRRRRPSTTISTRWPRTAICTRPSSPAASPGVRWDRSHPARPSAPWRGTRRPTRNGL